MSETKTEYRHEPSGLLPRDAFSKAFAELSGHPGGAHTQPTVVKLVDAYGNATDYIVQTVKWAQGETVFVTIVEADATKRVMLPPKVLDTIVRQREAVQTTVRRRHGRRIAAERKAQGLQPGFMKAKARKKK